MSGNRDYIYHLLALLTVAIWGTTFVSTKILIMQGLSPAEILLYRFGLAYVAIWFIGKKQLFAQNAKDEFLFFLSGLTGGTLYFLFENTALQTAPTSNVALIICTAPIFTAFLTCFFYRQEKLKRHLLIGSLLAFVGVALVVFNGTYALEISPLGDILTVLAALSWASYSMLLILLNKDYSVLLITRKVFFYGILSLLPYFYFKPTSFNISLFNTSVLLNLSFLGLIASLMCYVMWSVAVKRIGVIKTSNYIYISPIVTLIASYLLLDERITGIAIVGSVFILVGLYIAERGFPKLGA